MDDPFGLLEIASAPKEGKQKALPKKTYLTVIAVMVLFVLGLSGFLIYDSSRISADIPSSSVNIKVTNLPSQVKTGQSISFNLVFSNRGDRLDNSYVLVKGEGINFAKTIDKAKGTKSGESGFTRKLTQEETLKFDQTGDSDFRYELGNLAAGESKTLTALAVVTSGSTAPAKIEVKLFGPKIQLSRCGALRLSRCRENVGDNQIATGIFQISPTDSSKIKLRGGFNFVSLPYVFTTGSLTNFLGSLKTKWAYVYDPTTAGYVDLNSADNTSKVKPGVAFWLYDKNGGEYDLPSEKVETNSNETYSLTLPIGWNQLGNPYSKRMVLSATKITVHELSDDGTESGVKYDLKTAISNGTLSDPYFVVYPSSNSTAITTVKAQLESTLEPFSGFMIKANKRVNLVIPGKEVITAGDNLSAEERSKIENWISENGLNQYGDPAGTVYAGGTPLYNETTGQTIDRFDYILERNPDRPWNR